MNSAALLKSKSLVLLQASFFLVKYFSTATSSPGKLCMFTTVFLFSFLEYRVFVCVFIDDYDCPAIDDL